MHGVKSVFLLSVFCFRFKQRRTLLFAAMCDCEDCLGRTPYASLIATTVMCVGVGLFCGTGFRALDLTLNGIFEGLFKFHVSWYVELFQLHRESINFNGNGLKMLNKV